MIDMFVLDVGLFLWGGFELHVGELLVICVVRCIADPAPPAFWGFERSLCLLSLFVDAVAVFFVH